MADPADLRRAVRALVVDEESRVLLVRLEFPNWVGWALPGGGVEQGEDDVDAVRRELEEEVGLVEPSLLGPMWERTIHFADPIQYRGQTERIFLVRCAPFTPAPRLSREVLRAEGLTDIRWWTRDELAASTETLAPSRLVALLDELAQRGPPAVTIDIGE